MGQRYDTLIVGAGPAGCVFAARLSQDPTRRVMLLEAGPDRTSTSAEAPQSFFVAGDDAGRLSVDVVAERSRDGASRPYLLGRGIGGGSAVNAMIGLWGVPEDYDRWERDFGCNGWSWSDVAPVFASLPVPLTHADKSEWGRVDGALVSAARAAGHEWTDGPLRLGVLGVGPAWLTRVDGRRASVDDVYLQPVRSRPNLTVRADTTVDHVVLDGYRASGVVATGGELFEADEVIICCGAIHSPLLLLRSAVERSGIGIGLKDHVSARVALGLREPADTNGLVSATMLRWSSAGDVADLQLLPLNHVGVPDYGALMVAVMSAHSSGSVTIEGGLPTVRFNMLDDERDRARLRDAARHMALLATASPFGEVADGIYIDDVGTSIESLPDDDAAFDAWLRDNVGDYVHASATCRMGVPDDPSSVVDTAGRVHGYAGLRVCDASIFPDLPRANTTLPTVMVAERIAAEITAS